MVTVVMNVNQDGDADSDGVLEHNVSFAHDRSSNNIFGKDMEFFCVGAPLDLAGA